MRSVQRATILAVLFGIWEISARAFNNELLFPTLSAVCRSLWNNALSGVLLSRLINSLIPIGSGFAVGLAFAAIFALIARRSPLGREVITILTATFTALPWFAAAPFALIWFGLGSASLVFVLSQAIMWPMTEAALAHLKSSPSASTAGAVSTGLQSGWRNGWFTLIATEMAFGLSRMSGGLGWFISDSARNLNVSQAAAGLVAVVAVALLVEKLLLLPVAKMMGKSAM
jgi:NitT/TauT family transport system permease protein